MPLEMLRSAISDKRLVSFYYDGDQHPGMRVVEPHLIAYNLAGHLSLRAWYLSGASESFKGPGWREYLLQHVSDVILLHQNFASPRPGHNRTGGKEFHSVQCAV